MRGRLLRPVFVTCALAAAAVGALAQGQDVRADAPADLRALLAPAGSEVQLVAVRYTADRVTLHGNYVASGRGGRGGAQGAAQAAARTESVQLSHGRVARLKRFDLDWQSALEKVDVSKLSGAGRTELDDLKATIRKNLAALDADVAAIAELTPLVPFADDIIRLSEARMRMEDVDSRKAAGVVNGIAKRVAAIRQRVERGLEAPASDGSITLSREAALRGADGLEQLRAGLAAWFNFYNGYDPLFTWWTGLPFKEADAALGGYAALLRDKVSAAGQTSNLQPAPLSIAPAPAPKIASVPDILQMLALPRDEMTPVVQRFLGQPGGGRGGASRGGSAPPRDRQYYDDWRAALKTLDFPRLTRNAQVDYLFIRKSIETQLARLDAKPQGNIPRKTDASGIPGAARGRDGLIQDLREELISYTPEELIALANKEFAWCEQEIKKASRQMGFGDDWKKAIEAVKDMHVAPGGQPAMIRGLLFEAIDYLRAKDLITVPQVAGESLRMGMMSPERQLVNPFFTGGALISVSYPTDTMSYDARIQSMRGNNIPFSNATAFHEMIPGHNLIMYMGQRFASYRARIGGNTPFFGEGWPVYWETILYDKGFHDTPAKRIGALFWRMHRCARIIFSLNFHMGIWSPQESVDFLVERVGHERENAIAEVRRSFEGSYSPLYQAAYLLGALQLRGLRKEVVDSGQMTEKAFHDEIMRQGSMPIAYLRLVLTRTPLTPDMDVDWKFYGER